VEILVRTFLKNLRVLFKIFILALSALFAIILTIFVPRLIASVPVNDSKKIFEYLSTQPLLGFPIPFYVVGRTPRLYDIKYYLHGIKLPLHLYFGNPYRSGGFGIFMVRLLADFLILFIPLFIFFMLKPKLSKKLPLCRFKLQNIFKRFVIIFISSIIFVIGTAFLYPRNFYKADLIGKYDYIHLGFPANFISIYLKPNTLKFPYHLTSKTIFRAIFHHNNCSYGLFVFDVIVVSVIFLLMCYVYSENR